jgi:hypothetical protein
MDLTARRGPAVKVIVEMNNHPQVNPDPLREPADEILPAEPEGPESLRPAGGPENAGAPPFEVRIIRDWDADAFHQRVLQLESQGYVSRRETYRISPEMNPDTGEVLHLHSIELVRSVEGSKSKVES